MVSRIVKIVIASLFICAHSVYSNDYDKIELDSIRIDSIKIEVFNSSAIINNLKYEFQEILYEEKFALSSGDKIKYFNSSQIDFKEVFYGETGILESITIKDESVNLSLCNQNIRIGDSSESVFDSFDKSKKAFFKNSEDKLNGQFIIDIIIDRNTDLLGYLIFEIKDLKIERILFKLSD